MVDSALYLAVCNQNLALIRELARDPSIDSNQGNRFGDTPLAAACREGHVEIAKCLLEIPGLDPNLAIQDGFTPLHVACINNQEEIVALLLSDERIDVNKSDEDGRTPLWAAAFHGFEEVVSVLLEDDRVDVNLAEEEENTSPLWVALSQCHLRVFGLLLAHEKTVVTKRKWVPATGGNERQKSSRKMKEWLEEYQADPEKLRSRLRREIRGELFALVVFLSDGYLRFNQTPLTEKKGKTLRFFSLALRLPMELQMVLCNRVFGLGGFLVKKKDSEDGFTKFAKEF